MVSLDPVWDGQIEILRGWGRAKRLVCPVCRQAVLLRAGEIMRRHFAHKDLIQCPLSHESAEVPGSPVRLAEHQVSGRRHAGKTLLTCWLRRLRG